MKPEEDKNTEETDNPTPVAGDVIGDTAYSERFVLKILLKLANLDTLKHEILEKTFEDDLCTLWDMTAERDVVLFLQKHDILNLINFALSVLDSPRIIEIIIGIVGNMCCQKEVVTTLLRRNKLLSLLLEYSKCEDSLVLIQLLRLVNSCLFLANNDDIAVWLNMFVVNEYSTALYFILKNSSNKEVLVTALENLNTICSYCNIEKCRLDFFEHFLKVEALESLSAAFTEITVKQKDVCEKDELERVLVISLQIVLNLIGFDKSQEIYFDSKENVITMINFILNYNENKFVTQKEIDSDLIDIIDSTNTVVNILKVSEISEPNNFFCQSYNMWKALLSITKSDKNGTSNFEEEDKEELQDFSVKMKMPLSTLMCIYISQCSDEHLLKVLDDIGKDYEDIVSSVKDKELLESVSKRVSNYRTRLKENVDA